MVAYCCRLSLSLDTRWMNAFELTCLGACSLCERGGDESTVHYDATCLLQAFSQPKFHEGCCVCAAFVRGDDEGTVHDDATWLLDFYDTFRDCLGNDVLDLALNSLANVEGRFGEAALQSAIRAQLIMLSLCWRYLPAQTAGLGVLHDSCWAGQLHQYCELAIFALLQPA